MNEKHPLRVSRCPVSTQWGPSGSTFHRSSSQLLYPQVYLLVCARACVRIWSGLLTLVCCSHLISQQTRLLVDQCCYLQLLPTVSTYTSNTPKIVAWESRTHISILTEQFDHKRLLNTYWCPYFWILATIQQLFQLFGPLWNMSAIVGMKFYTDIHDPWRINTSAFVNLDLASVCKYIHFC